MLSNFLNGLLVVQTDRDHRAKPFVLISKTDWTEKDQEWLHTIILFRSVSFPGKQLSSYLTCPLIWDQDLLDSSPRIFCIKKSLDVFNLPLKIQ